MLATTRARATIGRVCDDLGSTLLDPVTDPADRAAEIGGIAIADPLDDQSFPPGALVLGIGVRTATDVAALIDGLRADAVGLIVRAPAPRDPELLAELDRRGLTLLELAPGASWVQLVAMLRALSAEDTVASLGTETLGGLPSGDLFALANAIAALLDAPITIEDRQSRVLAFSGRQEEADGSRIQTVLGRQVPQRYARYLADSGTFQQLHHSAEPVYVEPPDDGQDFSMPRTAIAVRAGDEILGSIWAAVPEPLSAERIAAMRDAATLVALHLLRLRAGADVGRRLHADLLSTALEGGAGATEALTRLGLSDQALIVLAMTVVDSPPAGQLAADASLAVQRERASDAFALHLTAVHPSSPTALLGDVTYGLLPVDGTDADGGQRAMRIARDFIARIGPRVPVVVGIGDVARSVGALADARLGADRALRVLVDRGRGERVAHVADVGVDDLLLELRDLVAQRDDRPSGPLARLLAHDARHGSTLVATVHAWLDAFGDVPKAARRLHVHPNTFRYRLRRVTDVCGLDLGDPDARFAAMVQLRVIPELARAGRLPESPDTPARSGATRG